MSVLHDDPSDIAARAVEDCQGRIADWLRATAQAFEDEAWPDGAEAFRCAAIEIEAGAWRGAVS